MTPLLRPRFVPQGFSSGAVSALKDERCADRHIAGVTNSRRSASITCGHDVSGEEQMDARTPPSPGAASGSVPILEGDDIGASALPTVSFIVANYNYGAFLPRCLNSIFSQSYRNIECIVVDDASTDDSARILRDISFPSDIRSECLFNEANLGQTRACIEGYRRSRGEYIAFIDADDELDPDYALAHLWTHFTSRRAIGFSSCDLITSVDGQIVLTTLFQEDSFRQLTLPVPEADLRPLPPRVASQFEKLRPFKVHEVRAEKLNWVWAPTSGNVYRKDAVALFLDNDRLGKLKYSMDAYLNFPIHSLCGSRLIDQSFGIYHVHRENYFVRSALLANLRSFDSQRDFGSFAAYCALEHIVLNFDAFADKVWSLEHLRKTMSLLARKARESSWAVQIWMSMAKFFLAYNWKKRLSRLLPLQR